jgi:hypothetical protein
MTKEVTILLPVFNDREFTETFNKQTLELSDKLVEVLEAWITSLQDAPENERPSAFAVGAAAYVALLKLAETVGEEERENILSGCANTLLRNDTKYQLLLANLPPTPN